MLSLVKTKGGVGELSIQNPPPLLLLIRGLAVVFLSWQNNVCPVKIRSKRSSVLLLCLLRIFTGQTLKNANIAIHYVNKIDSTLNSLKYDLSQVDYF